MEWLTYLLKVSACMALFYAFYHLFLQKLTFFSSNRCYLLATLMLSFLIPVLQFEVQRDELPEKRKIYTETSLEGTGSGQLEKTQPVERTVTSGSSDYNWEHIMYDAYWIVAASMTLLFIFQLLYLLRQTKNVTEIKGGIKVVYKPYGFTNCSFLNYVFVNRRDLNTQEVAVIIQHERVHAYKFHSIDKLIIAICKILLWFNPFVYLYSRAMEQVHEYEADRDTSLIVGNQLYASMLLNFTVTKNNRALVHSFVKNPMKERIKMLFTNQSKNMKKLIYFISLPIGLGLTWVFGVQVVYSAAKDNLTISADKAVGVNSNSLIDSDQNAEKIKSLPKEIRKSKVKNDTLRLVGYKLGKEPEVIIDGRHYDPDILTKISPKCVLTMSSSSNKINLKTKNNKVEYATKTDIENVRVKIEAEKSDRFYIRYAQKYENGETYDVARIKAGRGEAAVDVMKGGKVLILIDGKKYSEKEAKNLSGDAIKDVNVLRAIGNILTIEKSYPEYSKEYNVVLQATTKAYEEKIPVDNTTGVLDTIRFD